jgi:regulator of sigma E protease
MSAAMTALGYLASFVLAIGILVTVHEFGHFWVARRCGVRILRFSIGFGRPLLRWQRDPDSCEWVLGAIPLGGYVKMLDEREAPVPDALRSESFNRKNVWQRIAIVSAGPLANFLLAILIYWVLFMIGVTELRPLVGAPLTNSPAARAGLRAGDRVLAINDLAVESWSELGWQLVRSGVDRVPITLSVQSEGQGARKLLLATETVRIDGKDVDIVRDLGLSLYRPNLPPVIGQIQPGSPADRAGLRAGDRIVSIDGAAIHSWDDLVAKIAPAAGRSLTVRVAAASGERALSVVPVAQSERGKTIGRIGIGVAEDRALRDKLFTRLSYGPLSALGRAIRLTGETAGLSLKMFGRMLSGELSMRNISGPVTIADYAGQSARQGVEAYTRFVALISISIGLLNLFPIPLLDGGHIMYYLAEVLMRRPVSQRVMEIGQQIGFLILAMLMAFALFNDVSRLLS